LFDAKELVAVLVNLLTDLVAGLESHRDQLEVMTGIQNAAKIFILDRALFDVVTIAFHV
jgi:hypothetical protein